MKQTLIDFMLICSRAVSEALLTYKASEMKNKLHHSVTNE